MSRRAAMKPRRKGKPQPCAVSCIITRRTVARSLCPKCMVELTPTDISAGFCTQCRAVFVLWMAPGKLTDVLRAALKERRALKRKRR